MSRRTKKSAEACRRSGQARSTEASATSEPPLKKSLNLKSKSKRFPRLQVSKFIKNNIHCATELYSVSEERRKEGQPDLAALVLSCTKKSLNDLIGSTRELQNENATIKREESSRMLVKARLNSCAHGCYIECYICSRYILQTNNINPYIYADAIRDLLIHGRGKLRNVMITGPANCAKTLMLSHSRLSTMHLVTRSK